MRQPLDSAAARAEPFPSDRLLTAAIALGAALPMLHMGIHNRIDYDGWWHVFIARAAPWAQFWRDVHDNAHPPAFYLLLRAAASLGTERIVYRAISIAAAVVATYLIGRLAARLLRTPRLAPLCALAFGLALSTVVMACAVRSYMLGIALLLVAVGHWLVLIDPRATIARRTRIAFAAAMSAAIATNYAAVFVAVAAATLPLLYAAVDPPYRRWLGARLRREGAADLATSVPIAAVVLAVWSAHVADFPFMPHTAQFELGAAEAAEGIAGIFSFLARSLIAEIQLFAPLPLATLPAAARAAVVALLVAVAAGLWAALRRRADWPIAAAPLAILALVAGQMMLAALLGRYPFGGYLRHQYVLFPFLVLAGFALIDELVARLRRPRLALAAVAAAVVLSSAAQWRRVHLVDVEPLGVEAAQFAALFPDSGAVYVDRFSLIPFIASQQRHAWADQLEVAPDLVAVPVRDGERTLLVLRDMERWSADLGDPALYRDLRGLFDRTGLPSVDVFRLRQDAHLLPPAPRATRAESAESILRQARAAGLRVERLVLDGLHVYARLRPAGGTLRMKPAASTGAIDSSPHRSPRVASAASVSRGRYALSRLRTPNVAFSASHPKPAHPECERSERIEGAIWTVRLNAHRPLDTLAALALGVSGGEGHSPDSLDQAVLRQSRVSGTWMCGSNPGLKGLRAQPLEGERQ